MFALWDLVTFILSLTSVGVQWLISKLSMRPEKATPTKLGTLFSVGLIDQLIYIYYFIITAQFGILINPGLSTAMYSSNLIKLLFSKDKGKELPEGTQRDLEKMAKKLTEVLNPDEALFLGKCLEKERLKEHVEKVA